MPSGGFPQGGVKTERATASNKAAQVTLWSTPHELLLPGTWLPAAQVAPRLINLRCCHCHGTPAVCCPWGEQTKQAEITGSSKDELGRDQQWGPL
jgi:hypothetical protein